jgi:hypothetical protein
MHRCRIELEADWRTLCEKHSYTDIIYMFSYGFIDQPITALAGEIQIIIQTGSAIFKLSGILLVWILLSSETFY